MNKKILLLSGVAVFGIADHLHAQVVNAAGAVQQMHTVLDGVYNQMIPLCSQVMGVAQSIGAFGGLFYIGNKVWKHIANAEQIDFYPLLRPFALILAISMFPQVLSVIRGVMEPSVTATAAIVSTSNQAVQALLAEQKQAIQNDTAYQVLVGPNGDGDRQAWYKYTHPNSTGENIFQSIGNDLKFWGQKLVYNIRYYIKYLLSIILEVLYFAAALCIDCIRTFHLIVLAILGPFAFGFGCYDGFHHSVQHWLARYINIYLWLPIANLFGAILANIQANMLKLDIAKVEAGSMSIFTPTDLAYLIFLCIGIYGYFTVPGIANYIIHVHGGNPISQKMGEIVQSQLNLPGLGGGGGSQGGSGGGGGSASGGGGAAKGGGGASGGASNTYNLEKIAGA